MFSTSRIETGEADVVMDSPGLLLLSLFMELFADMYIVGGYFFRFFADPLRQYYRTNGDIDIDSGSTNILPKYIMPSGSDLGGGPYNGYSPVQTINNAKSSDQVMMRRILRNGWNTPYATGTVNGKSRVVTPFRAVNNLGDFLGRENYVCGGPNQVNASKPGWKSCIGSIISNCDGSGIPSSTCNVKYVPDSSEYTKFRKLQVHNQNYNDKSHGGDDHNASFVSLMRVRRS